MSRALRSTPLDLHRCLSGAVQKAGGTAERLAAHVRAHYAAWVCVLIAASAVRLFWGLGDQPIRGDEWFYVRAIDRMLATGDWIYLEEYPGVPYLRKPPLYFWLTAATLPCFDGDRSGYRVWSAAFGLACVAATCALGRRLFGPGVGLTAGLLLLLNPAFVHYHGARYAGFDAALTLLMLLCLHLWWGMQRGPRPWRGWALIGVCIGGCCLLKPLIGVPLLAILAAHHLLFARGAARGARLGGPALALAVGCLLAAPWYLAQWLHHGERFTHAIFWENYVERATTGLYGDPWHLQGPVYYLVDISRSSRFYILAVPAFLAAAYASVAGPRRHGYRLVVVPAALWVLMFSLSTSKLSWYVYPAYPLIALAIAQLLAAVGARLFAAGRPAAVGGAAEVGPAAQAA